MIHYLKIKNFGPIQETVELTFEVSGEQGSPAYEVTMPDGKKLLKLAYIYGPNASGKTTVLRAIDFLRTLWLDPAYVKDEELQYDPFLFRPDADNYSSLIELSFYMAGIRYIYEVNFSKKSIRAERMTVYHSNQPTELFRRETDLVKRLSHVYFGHAVKGAAIPLNALATATLHNNTVLGAFQKINVDLPVFEQLNKWGKGFFISMIDESTDLSSNTSFRISQDPKFAAWMNIFLNKADTSLRGVIVKDAKPSSFDMDRQVNFLHAMDGNDVYSLPLDKESSGSARYFGLGGVLYRLLTQPSFAGIDELGSSLHPDLMKYFLQVFLLNSDQSQLLFTTHNLFFLDDDEFIRKDALWFTEKSNYGEVSLFSAADFDSKTLRKDASLINAYKSGRLGAKPNLGSPYLNME
jgi:AAA15 family ATPase/GTPase